MTDHMPHGQWFSSKAIGGHLHHSKNHIRNVWWFPFSNSETHHEMIFTPEAQDRPGHAADGVPVNSGMVTESVGRAKHVGNF